MRIRVLMAMVAAGSLLGLAACGSNGPASPRTTTPPARSLVSSALAALKAARSVKLSGTVIDEGKTVGIDLGFFRSGALSGSLRGPFAGRSSVSFHLIVTRGEAYVLVDRQFFRSVLQRNGAPASACATYCGKYIKASAKQFKTFNLNGLTKQIVNSAIKTSPTVTRTTVRGQPAYRLRDSEGDYLYVAKTGAHRLIEVTRSGSGTIVFSEWDSVPPITAPPASQIINSPPGSANASPGVS